MRRQSSQWGKVLMGSVLIIGGISLANAHEVDDDNEEKVVKTYELSGFDEISVSGVYDMEVEVGEDFSIRVEGRAKEMTYVDIRQEGDKLILARKKKKKKWGWNNNQKSVHAYITMPALNALNVSGVTDADIDGVDSERFELNVSGVADVNISGRCNTLEANVSGVSDVEAKALECESGEVNLSGVGDMDVFTSKAIDVSVHGVGDVTVYGSPEQVEKSVSKYTASLTIK